ncbi:betaine/carnitine transporter, BCCT family [Alkalispirochaeta americana]|uniref:Betaine/carnitine transporter, BCCT family n=1 Tax=Alkalispirochaeta americana TaxID=159291 RepID=A0A1N6S319_9SPIO|nr:betaine/carnitine transporter, BCCT family [Alkalispirochaeta americana]
MLDAFKGPKVDKVVFIPSVAITLFLAVYFVINPEDSLLKLSAVFTYMTDDLGWTYVWFTLAAFASALYLIFGKYGKRKLGDEHDKPDFSTFSWIGMIFTASTGSSLLYWGMIEWIYFWKSPPLGAEAGSWQAAELASAYGMFHWGFTAWAMYAVVSIAIAYAYHVKKKPILRLSEATRGILGDRVDGPIGKAIDIFFMFGLIGGVTTSMGLGTPMLTAGICKLTGLEHTQTLEIIVITTWTLSIGFTLLFGLERGIRRMSDLNIYLAFGVLGFLLFFGGHFLFIVNHTTSAVGTIFQNFMIMSFWTDAVGQSKHPQWWTVFYWAWWVVYAPAMGLYIAKISRGRTIRQTVLGSVFWGTLGSWIFFAILGNHSMGLFLSATRPESFSGPALNVIEIFDNVGVSWAIVESVAAAPLGSIVLAAFVLLAFISMVTGQTTIAFTLASVCTKELKEEDEPARWNSFFWALVLGSISVSLLLFNALQPLQTTSIVAAFPLMGVLILVAISFFKMIREDDKEAEKAAGK